MKARWQASHYKVFQVKLRLDDDAEMIQWIEDHKEAFDTGTAVGKGTSNLFRRAVEMLMESEHK